MASAVMPKPPLLATQPPSPRGGEVAGQSAPHRVIAAEPPARSARPADLEPPPWLDEPPDEDLAPAPRAAPLRAAAPPALTLPASLPPAEEVQLTPLGDRWFALVNRLAAAGAVSALVRELAWQGGLKSVDETASPPVWTLTVERESLRNPVLRDRLTAALGKELGGPVQIEVEAGVPADTPAWRDAAERVRRQAQAEETIRADPVVRELMAQFKSARIVPGSIKPV
jgi:DNA polymerase-3 subunit gamma/tau